MDRKYAPSRLITVLKHEHAIENPYVPLEEVRSMVHPEGLGYGETIRLTTEQFCGERGWIPPLMFDGEKFYIQKEGSPLNEENEPNIPVVRFDERTYMLNPCHAGEGHYLHETELWQRCSSEILGNLYNQVESRMPLLTRETLNKLRGSENFRR